MSRTCVPLRPSMKASVNNPGKVVGKTNVHTDSRHVVKSKKKKKKKKTGRKEGGQSWKDD